VCKTVLGCDCGKCLSVPGVMLVGKGLHYIIVHLIAYLLCV
jgi:hypothetical protein